MCDSHFFYNTLEYHAVELPEHYTGYIFVLIYLYPWSSYRFQIPSKDRTKVQPDRTGRPLWGMSSPADSTSGNTCSAGSISQGKREVFTNLCNKKQWLFSTFNTIKQFRKRIPKQINFAATFWKLTSSGVWYGTEFRWNILPSPQGKRIVFHNRRPWQYILRNIGT